MQETAGRTVDANLLLALDALLAERNLTHAGARLMVSQPAMSGALSRLRKHFGDELLVRAGRDFELTPFAKELQPVVRRSVEAADRLLGRSTFDPTTTSRVFSVCLTEYAMTVMAEPLLHAIDKNSKNIDIAFEPIPLNIDTIAAQLLRRDLLIGPVGFGIPGQRQPLFTDEFVCVSVAGNPRRGPLTLSDLAELPFAVAHFGPGGTNWAPDEVILRRAGIERRTVAVVPSLLALPFAIAGTDLFAFIPRRLARRCADLLDLVVVDTALERIDMVEAAHWHPSRAGDPALLWLRELLHDVAVTLESDGS